MPTTYSLVGPHLKVARSATDFDLYDLRGNTKISDVAEVVTITQGQSNKKFEIPYASFDPVLSGSGAFMTLFNAQVNRVISVPSSNLVVSALWGYDSGTGTNVFVKEYADGTESYESPIDTPYTPIGAISKTNTIPSDLIMMAVSTNGLLNTPGSVLELSITCQSGAGTFTINGVTYNSVIGFQKTYQAKVLGDGSVKKVPAFTVDGGGATTLIIEYTT